jgi:hypothetical protein
MPKKLTTPTPAASLICHAIHHRLLLQFHYHARLRVVAPYCFGVSSRGIDVLRAIQVRGLSTSGGTSLGFGKLWAVEEMVDLQRLDEIFTPDDPNYNPNDKAMVRIHCRI